MRLRPCLPVALSCLAALSWLAGPAAAADPACAADAGWDTPSPPRHVHGSTWFVGTCGISAILVASPQGHVLLDGGTARGGELIAASIRAAGFRLEDVRYIGLSHEHFDHAGGIAGLQQASGATVVGTAAALRVLQAGRSDRSDPQLLELEPFAPLPGPVRELADGEVLELGPLRLVLHATPGHAPGGSSWSWRSCAAGECLDIAYADSLTAISDEVFRYSAEDEHPGYLAAFRASLDKVAGLPCDILLTPHPGASELWSRLARPGACRAYADAARERLEQRLARERANR